MKVLRALCRRAGFHPRAAIDTLLTYPRFLGRLKPRLLAGQENEVLVRQLAMGRAFEPKALQVPIGKRLLVVTPHPDDEAIGIGGLLLAHRGKSEIHLLNVFSGSGGGHLVDRPFEDSEAYRRELVEERRKELGRVARAVGATSVNHLNLEDGAFPQDSHISELRKIVQRIRPDVVLLPWFLDNQRDHKVANLMFASACRGYDCLVLGFEIWTFCQPNAYLDITEQLEEKVRLVDLYRTQVADLDYVGYTRGLAKTRAFLQGVRGGHGAAEAVLALPNRDYSELVLRLFGRLESPSAAGTELLEASMPRVPMLVRTVRWVRAKLKTLLNARTVLFFLSPPTEQRQVFRGKLIEVDQKLFDDWVWSVHDFPWLSSEIAQQRLGPETKLYALMENDKPVCLGWVSRTANFVVNELQGRFEARPKTDLIWDCVTVAEQRRKGYFTQFLVGLQSLFPDTTFSIFCRRENVPSSGAIRKAGFEPWLDVHASRLGHRVKELRPSSTKVRFRF